MAYYSLLRVVILASLWTSCSLASYEEILDENILIPINEGYYQKSDDIKKNDSFIGPYTRSYSGEKISESGDFDFISYDEDSPQLVSILGPDNTCEFVEVKEDSTSLLSNKHNILNSASSPKLPESASFDNGIMNQLKGRDINAAPYRYCGNLFITFPHAKGNKNSPGRASGSGILIGPNHVLTAGHNIFHHEKGGWAREVIFTPAQHKANKPFGETKGVILKTFKNWIMGAGTNYDYDMGLIILDEPIGYKAGWAGLISIDDSFFSPFFQEENKEPIYLQIVGYPEKKVRVKTQGGTFKISEARMYEHSGGIKKYEEKRLYYEINTKPGQSGSPVIVHIEKGNGTENLEGYYVVGVHTHGFNETVQANEGTRLTTSKLECILKEISKFMLLAPSTSSFSYGFKNIKQPLSSLNVSEQITDLLPEQMSTTILNETSEEESLTLLHYFKDNLKEEHPIKKTAREATSSFMETRERPLFESLGSENMYLDHVIKGGTPVTYFTALSIDGGGIRDLIPALLLEYFAKQIPGHYMHELFDYIGGASAGGLIALGLTTPSVIEPSKPHLSPSDIVDLFENQFKEAVHQSYLAKFFLSPINPLYNARYDPTRLDALLQRNFNAQYFHQSLTNTVIPVLECESSKTFIFDSYHAKRLINNRLDVEIPAWEIGRSTTAAPTYFPPYTLEFKKGNKHLFSKTFMDSPQNNNPANFVAKHLYQWAQREQFIIKDQNIIMLSLGTGYIKQSKPFPKNSGTIGMLGPILDNLITHANSTIDHTLRYRLKTNFYRVNPLFDELCAIDAPSPGNISNLKTVAEAHYDQIDEFIAGDNSIFRKILETGEFRAKPLDQKGKGKERL